MGVGHAEVNRVRLRHGLQAASGDHRRVLAMLTYLPSRSAPLIPPRPRVHADCGHSRDSRAAIRSSQNRNLPVPGTSPSRATIVPSGGFRAAGEQNRNLPVPGNNCSIRRFPCRNRQIHSVVYAQSLTSSQPAFCDPPGLAKVTAGIARTRVACGCRAWSSRRSWRRGTATN